MSEAFGEITDSTYTTSRAMDSIQNLKANGTFRIVEVVMEMSNFNATDFATNIDMTKYRKEHPGDAKYFGVFIGFLVVILGTTGNGITVWAYARNRNLQTSFNVLIANLCLVELVFSAVVIPFILPGYLMGYNVYSQGLCSAVGYLYYTSLASSLYNLVAIAVNRYVGIVQSKKYQQLFTGRRLALCISSVWFVPAILYLPVVIGNGMQWRSNTLRCSIGKVNKVPVPVAIQWYNLGLNITFQAFPLLILVYLYTAIFRKVRQVKRKMNKHRKSTKLQKTIVRDISGTSSTNKNRSGTTSEDTGDELKPSSLIEGIGFKPVVDDAEHQNAFSQKTPQKTSDETDSEENNPLQDEQNANSTTAFQSDEEEKPPQTSRKRNSIWTLLLRNSMKGNNQDLSPSKDKVESPTVSLSTDHDTSDEETLGKSPPVEQHEEKEVQFRDAIELRSFRRKKSLSTPNMPLFNFSNTTVQTLNSLENQTTLQTKYAYATCTESSDQNLSDNEHPKVRVKSAYVKRKGKGRSYSDTDERKSKTSWSVRMKRNTREWAINMSRQTESDNESQPGRRPQIGTIARKVQEKRKREDKHKKKTRHQKKMLKKKQARERQLVYSSLTICIAFAACIMPTSLLYLYQVLAKQDIDASATLVVSCIAWLHAVANPLIYGYLNSQYRREYSKISRHLRNKLFRKNTYTPKSRC